MKHVSVLAHKFFQDENGRVVIFQRPNAPIITYFAAILLQKIIWHDSKLLEYIAFGALFTWAWLEIFQGTTYFRRALGVVVLVFSVASKI